MGKSSRYVDLAPVLKKAKRIVKGTRIVKRIDVYAFITTLQGLLYLAQGVSYLLPFLYLF